MIEVWKLTKRHLNDPSSANFKQISVFSKSLGHGVGTIDFSEKIAVIDDKTWNEILNCGDEYAKFKLGKIEQCYEIEIFPEHAELLLKSLANSPFAEFLSNLDEGYLTLRKVES